MLKKNKVLSGIAWSSIERFSVQGVQFIVSIILARLLTPNDFGLIAIVLIFTSIFQTINESGFSVALIYKLDRDETDFSTAFFSNIVIGTLSYLIIFSIAPIISKIYDIDIITPIMRYLGLNLIITSFGIVQTAKFTINVDFKTQAKASLLAVTISGIIGIILAIKFKNVYALVIHSIVFSILHVSLSWRYAKWRPKFIFSIYRFKYLFEYANKLILSRLISVIFEDLYSFAIGKIYSPSLLGYYNRANSLMVLSSRNIVGIVQRVSVPLLCEKQNDFHQMQQVLIRFIVSTAVIVFPILSFIMIFSKPLILVLLGENWLVSAELLLYVCPIGFFYLISTFNRNIFNATGRTELALKAEIIKKLIFVGVFFITVQFDIKILLLGMILNSILEMIFDTYFSWKQIGISLLYQLKSLVPVIIATITTSVFLIPILFISATNFIKLLLGFIIGLIIYTSLCYAFNIAEIRKILRKYNNL